MVAELPGEGLPELAPLGTQPGAGKLAQPLGITLALDEGGQHGPAGDPEEVAGDHAQLDLGVLQQLLDPLLLGGAHPDQLSPVAGRGPATCGSQVAARSWAAACPARPAWQATPPPAC